MNYLKVFKIFLSLKRQEIVEILRSKRENFLDNSTDVGMFVLFMFVSIPILWGIVYSIGLLTAYIFNQNTDYNTCITIGWLTFIFLIIVFAVIFSWVIPFIKWIARNWREAKRISEM